MEPLRVSAVIVTRGDVVLDPILDSLPAGWEKVVWDNGAGTVRLNPPRDVAVIEHGQGECAVYGRYAAIGYATGDVIYVQDDDVIVSDPQAIVDEWHAHGETPGAPDGPGNGHVVCNMPPEFRHAFYTDHALVGFGAAFHRDAPEWAFTRFALSSHSAGSVAWGSDGQDRSFFDRTCDIVFTALSARVLVDVPIEHLPYAFGFNRMYRQAEHVTERARMREMVKELLRGGAKV